MKFIHERRKYFIFDLESNYLATLGDRNKANWQNINQLDLQAFKPAKDWIPTSQAEWYCYDLTQTVLMYCMEIQCDTAEH